MDAAAAEAGALRVLAWLAGEEDLVGAFLAASGLSAAELRAQAGDADVLAGVLDFVMSRDAWVLEAARANDWPPERLAEIRAALPGGALPHWT